jgi:DNA gyrase/topoisomerase IV subunit A
VHRVDDVTREKTRQRLGYLDALLVAHEHRQEVVEVVESSEDEAEAVRGLVKLLRLDDETHALVSWTCKCDAGRGKSDSESSVTETNFARLSTRRRWHSATCR